jgi:hypothetical protein
MPRQALWQCVLAAGVRPSCSRLPVVQLLDFAGNALSDAVPGTALAHPSPLQLQLRLGFKRLDCEILLRYGIVVSYAVPMANCCPAPTASYARSNSTRGASSSLPLWDSIMLFLPLLCRPYVWRNGSAIIMWSVMKIMNPRLCQLCSVAWLKNILTNCVWCQRFYCLPPFAWQFVGLKLNKPISKSNYKT